MLDLLFVERIIQLDHKLDAVTEQNKVNVCEICNKCNC